MIRSNFPRRIKNCVLAVKGMAGRVAGIINIGSQIACFGKEYA